MRVLTRWNEELSPELGTEIFTTIALWFLEDANHDGRYDGQVLALAGGDPRPLCSIEIDYSTLSARQASCLRQAQALFSKRKDLDFGVDKEAVAVQKFRDSEESCRLTNECFRLRRRGLFGFRPRVERVLWHAQRKISSILGDVPKLSDMRFRFGPGATTQIPKRMASARAKLGIAPACSIELFPLARYVLDEMPHWSSLISEELLQGGQLPINNGKVAFVPKSAKELRSIVVEPSLNTMCQAGVGDIMASRLRSCGIDIRDQTRNQRLARKGSLDGSLATVDLSSASDSVSVELVFDLLGLDWGTFLSRFRTGTVTLKGSSIKLEKFSSMGNGFTFPLETLIFYAIAYGSALEAKAALRDVTSYGDDIILPVEAYPLLIETLTSCGFSVNREKSFSHGPFRESCGADYYQGIDIRPVYQKDRPRTSDLFRIYNFFKRNYEEDVCAYILSFIDPSIRLYGPDGFGDGHLLGEWVPIRKRVHHARGFGGYIFDTFTYTSRRSFAKSIGDRVLPLYTTYLTENQEDRGDIRGSDVTFSGKGSDAPFSVVVPGVKGYNRISIYTFKS